MSGAEPWTGSNSPGPPSPRLAEGSIPSEPVSIAASSLRMSPNRFSVRITSKRDGIGDELHRGVVDQQVVELDVGVVGGDPRHGLAPQPRGLEHVRLVDRGHARRRGAAARPRSRPARSARSRRPCSRRCRGRGRRRGRSRRSRSRRSARGRRAGRCRAIRSSRSGLARDQRGARAAPAAGSRTGRGPCAARAGPARARGASGSVRVPLRAADGAEQDRVGGAAGVEDLVGERGAVASIEAPPIGCSSNSNSPSRVEHARARRRRSPGRSRRPARTTIRGAIRPASGPRC